VLPHVERDNDARMSAHADGSIVAYASCATMRRVWLAGIRCWQDTRRHDVTISYAISEAVCSWNIRYIGAGYAMFIVNATCAGYEEQAMIMLNDVMRRQSMLPRRCCASCCATRNETANMMYKVSEASCSCLKIRATERARERRWTGDVWCRWWWGESECML